MKKAFSFGLAVMAMLMVFSGVALASEVTNPQDRTFTTSEISVGNAGAECEQLGIALGLGEGAFAYAYKFNEDGDEGAPNETETASFFDVDTGALVHSNTITISNSDGTYFDWSSTTNGIGAVMVKAGTGYNVWSYDPQVKSDSHLVAYEGKGVSHVTVCWNLDAAPPAQEWCSPGYWRQDHHLDSWKATGYTTGDKFSDKLGSVTLSKKGERAGANTDPTLLEVLQNPQFYGGDDFNAVGDLLSNAHPDVNFDGLRVEDSCPLN